MDPGVLATAFRDWRNAGILLQCGSRRRAVTLCATGDQQPRSEDRGSAGESLKQGEVGMVLGMLGHGVVKVGNGLEGDAELSHESLDEQNIGRHDTFIRGQGGSSFESLETLSDHLRRADVMVHEKTSQEWHDGRVARS